MKAGFFGPGHETMRHVSRRLWLGSGLATCGYLAAGGLASGQSAEASAPAGYTRPGPTAVRGRAPGIQTRVVSQLPNGEKTYAVIFGKGDEVFAGLAEFAEREKIGAGHFTGIGALSSATLGWFDAAHKAYRNIPISEQVELISLIGDLGLVNGVPQIHTHGAVGLHDGQVRGGHLLQAFVWPTVEVFFTALPQALVKKPDGETGLDFFDLSG